MPKGVDSQALAMDRQRLDKFLVYARFVKTRAVALDLVNAGRVRINGEKPARPDRAVFIGNVLTLALPHATLVIEVLGFAERRGSPIDAQKLYAIVQPD